MERSKGSSSLGNAELHGQVSPRQAPTGATELRERGECCCISLFFPATLLLLLANTSCFVWRDLSLRNQKILLASPKGKVSASVMQKGGSNPGSHRGDVKPCACSRDQGWHCWDGEPGPGCSAAPKGFGSQRAMVWEPMCTKTTARPAAPCGLLLLHTQWGP